MKISAKNYERCNRNEKKGRKKRARTKTRNEYGNGNELWKILKKGFRLKNKDYKSRESLVKR